MARARDIYRMRMQRPLWLRLRDARETSPLDLQTRFRVRLPPVPLVEIVHDLQIGLWDQPGLQWRGFCRADQGAAHIWLPPGQSGPENRWWIAHMLAHILSDGLPLEKRGAPLGTTPIPTASPNYPLSCMHANIWAHDLLVPDWLVGPVAFANHSLAELADMFEIDTYRMSERLRMLYPTWFA